jgi:hypothetical protein
MALLPPHPAAYRAHTPVLLECAAGTSQAKGRPNSADILIDEAVSQAALQTLVQVSFSVA